MAPLDSLDDRLQEPVCVAFLLFALSFVSARPQFGTESYEDQYGSPSSVRREVIASRRDMILARKVLDEILNFRNVENLKGLRKGIVENVCDRSWKPSFQKESRV